MQSRPAATHQRTLFDPRRDNPSLFSRSVIVSPSSSSSVQVRPAQPEDAAADRDRLRRKRTASAAAAASQKSADQTQTESKRSTERKAQQASGGAFFVILKKAYADICKAESDLQSQRNACSTSSPASVWVALMHAHISLANQYHNFLISALSPSVPVSMHSLPARYNIPARLWRHASLAMLDWTKGFLIPDPDTVLLDPPWIVDVLAAFVPAMYSFYTGLLEDPLLEQWKSIWMENLGDLARYQMFAVSLVLRLDQSRLAAKQQRLAKSQAKQQQQQQQNQQKQILQPPSQLHSKQPGILNPSQAQQKPVLSPQQQQQQLQGLQEPSVLKPQPSAESTPQIQILPKNSSQQPQSSKLPVQSPPDASTRPSNSRLQADKITAPSSDSGSIGEHAVQSWQVDEVSLWRQVSREWYFRALAEMPGTGRLHHQLGLLSRGSTEPLRGLYHFMKAITASHPFPPSKEAVLSLFSPRFHRDAAGADIENLFVHIHSILFTSIDLDDFEMALARFMEAVEESGFDQTQQFWAWTAAVNIAAVMQYGSEDSILRLALLKDDKKPSSAASSKDSASSQQITKAPVTKTKTIQKKASATKILLSAAKTPDGNDSSSTHDSLGIDIVETDDKVLLQPQFSAVASPNNSFVLARACRIMFNLLRLVLIKPTACSNVYTSTILTFLCTLLKCEAAKPHIEKYVPWPELATFLTKAPLRNLPTELKLLHGHVLPEDWSLRGMEWVGRRVYERGFWKAGGTEGDVYESVFRRSHDKGVVDEQDAQDMASRWRRVGFAANSISLSISGFGKEPSGWSVYGALERKLIHWQREEEEATVKNESDSVLMSSSSDDGELISSDDSDSLASVAGISDSESLEIQELKTRRLQLLKVIRSARSNKCSIKTAKKIVPSEGLQDSQRPLAQYTVLVFDTNVLLSALNLVQTVVSTRLWVCIIPISVIAELTELAKQSAAVGPSALSAIGFIQEASIQPKSTLNLQSSKGNYIKLATAERKVTETDRLQSVKNESVDDMIIAAALWQQSHWQAMMEQVTQAPKVTLVTFDRIMRLKARSSSLAVTNEIELKSMCTRPDG